MIDNKRTGLIAGGGALPEIWLASAQEQGIEVYAYRLIEENPASLIEAEKIEDVSLADLGRLLELLGNDDIEQVIFLGKVHKDRLYNGFQPDEVLADLLDSLPDYQDMTILNAINSFFEENGFTVLPQSTFIEDMLPPVGHIAGPEPTAEFKADLHQALHLAKELADFDIGQTLIYKSGQVVAVEALEGTDQTIIRAGQLAETGLIMAKAARPDQDLRSDIPAVGPETIVKLEAAGGRALIVEADAVLLIDKAKLIELADAAGITVVAG